MRFLIKALLLLLPAALFICPPAYALTAFEKDVISALGESALKTYKSLDGITPALDAMKKSGVDDARAAEIFLWFKEKAKALNELSVSLYGSGSPAKAIPPAKQALEIALKILGRNHAASAKGMNYLAELYKSAGDFGEAEALYKEAIESYRGIHGDYHPAVANLLINLAQLYTSQGKRLEVVPLYEEAIDIFERSFGREHASVASALSSLAMIYDSAGRLAEAEPLYKEAVKVSEKVYGKEHPSLAANLNNLGLLYYSSGRYGEAEPLYKRALEIYRKAYGREHPAVATALNNLGLLYTSAGIYDKAETNFKEALSIDEALYGKGHENLVSDLNNLAALYKDTGRLTEAEPLYKRALEIGERTMGKDHPALAAGYNNLALLYLTTGRYAQAEPLLRKALDAGIKSLGEEHPDVAAWMNNLAFLLAAEGKHLESHALFARGAELEHDKRQDIFTLLSEEQKLAYMKRTEGSIHAMLNLVSGHLNRNEKAVQAALDSWLRWKGAVMETQQRYVDALSSHEPAMKDKYEKLTHIRRKIARMKLQGGAGPEALGALEAERDSVEADLGRLSRHYALEKTAGRADSAKIASILLPDSVYLDFAVIRTYDFSKLDAGDFRYIAFVLQPGAKTLVRVFDLGSAKGIDGRINAYLDEIRSPIVFRELPRINILKEEASALYALILKPMETYLKGAKRLFISPEGNLNLIPFEVLMDSEGKYLLESCRISYVTAGRDIVRFASGPAANMTAMIMADPDYEMKIGGASRGGVSKELGGMKFSRLADTAKEADEIEKILKGKNYSISNLKGKAASEDALFRAESPRILHIATHGFFLKDARAQADTRESLGLLLLKEQRATPAENPMLRSGIVLSGANSSLSGGGDEGIISADKALALRLRGTELVVLSACDTGAGDVQRGEGVFGMKRAFILAGAKSLIMSLWSVPSAETTELMAEFYRLMADGKDKADALRLARLEMMRRHQNPFFWGAFVLTGNPS